VRSMATRVEDRRTGRRASCSARLCGLARVHKVPAASVPSVCAGRHGVMSATHAIVA